MKLVGTGSVGILSGLAGCGGDGGDGSNGGDGDGSSDGSGGSDGSDGGTTDGGGTETLTLAGTMPLTGQLAATGQAIRTGYRAAVQKINDMGGVPVGDTNVELSLEIQDDASDPNQATTLYQEFITQDERDFFIGSFSSGIILPTASIVQQNDKVMVQSGGGSDDIFTQGWDNIYGIYPRASRQMIPTVNYFASLEPELNTFSVITENDAYNKSLSEGVRGLMEDNGIEMVNNHGIPDNANDVSPVVSSVSDDGSQGLFVAAHGGTGQQIAKEISTQNVELDLIYEILGPWQPTFLDSVGDAGNYVHTITYFSPRLQGVGGEVFESAEAFATYTRDNLNDVPSPFNHQVASGAAAIVSYYHALKNAGEVSIDPVVEELNALSVDSFYGTIEYTDDGDGHPNKMGPMIAQIQDKEHQVVYPSDVASADPVYPQPS